MKRYEEQYFEGLEKIMTEGVVCVSGRQTDSSKVTRTKRTWGVQFVVDLEEEFPVLRSKHVAVKTAIREILWIMRKQSNNVKDLPAKIWDKWADEDGSINKSYGYQIGKEVRHSSGIYPSQVHYVLGLLEKDPSSRHALTDMWCPGELAEMNCVPCVYSAHFAILDGRLNAQIVQRSGDYMVGVPFNTTQYAALTIMFARHLGVKPGILIHQISDAHVYENQYGDFDTEKPNELFKQLVYNFDEVRGRSWLLPCTERQPKLVLKNDTTSFFDVEDNDFDVENYEIGKDCFEDIPFPTTV